MPFRSKRAILYTFLVAFITDLTWLFATSLATLSAYDSNTITVCPAGPPTCDFATIQAGLDSAQSGDIVLVYSGTYSEQVTLKSEVALRASDGPTSTTITAANGPILSAANIISAVLQGFTVQGQYTTPFGLKLIDSSLLISGTIIENLRGIDGTNETPAGGFAIGVWTTGTGRLTLIESEIRNLVGGNTVAFSSTYAGGATGLLVEGNIEVFLDDIAIHHLYGGSIIPPEFPEKGTCPALGANGMAIGTADANVVIQNSEIYEIRAGGGCYTDNWPYCDYSGGGALAVHALGGSLLLKDNQFSRLYGSEVTGSHPTYAVRTVATQGTYLAGNRLSLWPLNQQMSIVDPRPTPPTCPSETSSDYLVASLDDAWLHIVDNELSNLSVGNGTDAEGIGVQAQQTVSVSLAGNTLAHFLGAAGNRYTETRDQLVAIELENVNTAHIHSNLIHDIQGGPPHQLYGERTPAGDAIGIRLRSVTTAMLSNNIVWQIRGGSAGSYLFATGGNALALHLQQGNTWLEHNLFHQSLPGEAISGVNFPGRAMGWLIEGNVVAINNVLLDQQTAVSVAPHVSATFNHNNLWLNEQNFIGIQPPADTLYVDPLFAAPDEGDFHLRPDSPLVDAALPTTSQTDFEGEPRPLDGNNDGPPLPDIGADEFYPGLLGSLKTVDKLIAQPGDTLLYTFHIANPSDWLPINSAHLSDTLPAYLTYVPGSLNASAGSWGYSGGVITWTGHLPAGQSVSLTFQATIQPDLTGTHTLVNQAHLTDLIAAQPTLIRATTLVNPHQRYFPLIPKP